MKNTELHTADDARDMVRGLIKDRMRKGASGVETGGLSALAREACIPVSSISAFLNSTTGSVPGKIQRLLRLVETKMYRREVKHHV